MKHHQKPPLPQNCSTGAFPTPCSSCPPVKLQDKPSFTDSCLRVVGRAPTGCHGAAPPNWGPSGAPQQSQKQLLGLRLGRREDKCPQPGKGTQQRGEAHGM